MISGGDDTAPEAQKTPAECSFDVLDDVVTDFLILSLEIKINYILYLVPKGTVIFEYVIFDSILTLHFFHSFQIH